ncbi:MAG TPA: hypothetical protein VIJ69_05395 [Actinomycetota bacterium]
MTLVLDAAPLVAVADRRDSMQPLIKALLQEEPGELVVPAPVAAQRFGTRRLLTFDERHF